MADTVIPIKIDPSAAVEGMKKISQGAKELGVDMEEALGKNIPKSMNRTEEAVERGSNKISTMFRNLGKRVKEDLKTAFDVGSVMQGLNMAKTFAEGTKQIFDMERAFDRLNTRLGLSNSQMLNFKKNVMDAAAASGQRSQDILPGVETAASKGGVKSPAQLSSIAGTLAQARAVTGEDVTSLSGKIVQIIQDRGEEVTAKSFKQTMDAIQGTRVSGNFANAGEAADAIGNVTHGLRPDMLKQLGIGTREAGGLSAAASLSGEEGQGVLKGLLAMAASPGGGNLINSTLGKNIVDQKTGKLDVNALGKINKNNLGQFSGSTMAQTLGVDEAAFARFIESMKKGQGNFTNVVDGINENSSQFAIASDNLAFQFDHFTESVKVGAAEIGDGLSSAVHSILKGDIKGALKGVTSSATAATNHAGALGAGLAVSVGSALLMGGGIRSLFGKIGGGIAKGKLAEAAGIQPVYVTNFSEMAANGGGGAVGTAAQAAGMGMMKTLAANAMVLGGASMGEIGMMGAGAIGMAGVGLAGAGAAGYGIGSMLNGMGGNEGWLGDALYNMMNPDELKASTAVPDQDFAGVKQAIIDGHKAIAAEQKPVMTQPGSVPLRGG